MKSRSELRLSLRGKQQDVQIANHRQDKRVMDPDAVGDEALDQRNDRPTHCISRSFRYSLWHH